MATKYNSVESDNFTTAIGGAPGAGDTVHINRFARRYNAGLSVATNKAALFKIAPESACEFADAGGLVCKTDEFVNMGNQQKLLVASSSSAGEITKFVNAPVRSTSVTQLGSCIAATGIYNKSGILTILDTVDTAGDVEVAGGDVTIVYSGSLLIDGYLRVMGGIARARRRAEEIEVGGTGVMILDEPSAAQGDLVQTGGRVEVADSGTLDLYVGRAGVIDFSRLSRDLTISDWTEYPWLTVIVRANGPTITKTAAAAPYGPAKYLYV